MYDHCVIYFLLSSMLILNLFGNVVAYMVVVRTLFPLAVQIMIEQPSRKWVLI
eukprot:TRINITY_DN1892_c0_g1_i1.p4 TRINITY_DN1892_c0_g1~~TRINITY_DN1892_c0_g1_i1.p4  ORF type:complete len:53 (-),score=0.68 TRINITY_DN1892_c0_g1_i1:226-384(-)